MESLGKFVPMCINEHIEKSGRKMLTEVVFGEGWHWGLEDKEGGSFPFTIHIICSKHLH